MVFVETQDGEGGRLRKGGKNEAKCKICGKCVRVRPEPKMQKPLGYSVSINFNTIAKKYGYAAKSINPIEPLSREWLDIGQQFAV